MPWSCSRWGRPCTSLTSRGRSSTGTDAPSICMAGYPASEAVGRNVAELLVHADDIGPATSIIGSTFTGRCWRGKFPVRNKSGERFSILTNGTPLYDDDDDGTMIGLVCLSLR
ncbi:hypothetical protein GQ55_6G273800 [Panicum hallii var. hallii]|uniref:Uncharacterized protein n=1 Tax=Panicum hallii var. hallii TaxID=1504633 RepID=A0A2T7DA84_9POAL|nr:hypothetical protein GQ55_6G273800 [Panicum hallii var. hallii]